MKLILTGLGIGAVLVGWGVAWANQNGRISTNKTNIDALSKQVENVSSQATEPTKQSYAWRRRLSISSRKLMISRRR